MPPRTFALLASLAAAVFCVGVALSLPIGAGADEIAHCDYAGFLAREGRLPEKGREVVFQAHHPPLYYAVLGALHALQPRLSEDEAVRLYKDPPPPVVLPYERRVALRWGSVIEDPFGPNNEAARAHGRGGAAPRPVTVGSHLEMRLLGVPLLALTAFLLFRGARGAAERSGRDLRAAALAAGATVLVPQFAGTFGPVNNDQFAVLFSTAGLAVLYRAGPEIGGRRALGAGILLGLGLLSKLFVAGPIAAAAAYVWLCGGAARTRLRTLAFLAIGPVVLAGPWIARQIALYGGVDPVSVSGTSSFSMLREPPDAAASADLIGTLASSWFSSIGAERLGAGALLGLLAAAFPLVAVFGSVSAARRAASRPSRAAAGAFLAGLAVQLALVVAANRRFQSPQGRYLHVLALPGAVALAEGAAALFGRRARAALAALVVVAAVAGVAVLHGKVIPTYHARNERFASPDFVAYLDAGGASEPAPTPPNFVIPDLADFVPKPERTAVADAVAARAATPPLDPAGTFVAWVGLSPASPWPSIEDFQFGRDALGGPFSPQIGERLIRLPIPRAQNGAARDVVARKLVGEFASLTEVLVTRLPIDAPAARIVGDEIAVSVRSPARGRLPVLAVALLDAAETYDPASLRGLAFDATGRAEARFRAQGGAPATLSVGLVENPTTWADFKLRPLMTGAGEAAVALGAPGYAVIGVPASAAAGAEVARVPDPPAPPWLTGAFRAEALDETGAPVPKGRLAFVAPDGSTSDAAGGDLALPARTAPGRGFAVVVSSAGSGLLVDRVRLLRRHVHVFDVPLAR